MHVDPIPHNDVNPDRDQEKGHNPRQYIDAGISEEPGDFGRGAQDEPADDCGQDNTDSDNDVAIDHARSLLDVRHLVGHAQDDTD